MRTCRQEAIRLAKRITALDAELADNRQALDSAVNAQIRTQITDRTIGTAFRDEWQGDYPSRMEFLEPLLVTGAGSNDVDYSHSGFDAALTAAEAAPALPESCALTNAALPVLSRDMPVVPLWDYISAAARLRSERIVKS